MDKEFSIKQFSQRFPDDDACLEEIKQLRFGDTLAGSYTALVKQRMPRRKSGTLWKTEPEQGRGRKVWRTRSRAKSHWRKEVWCRTDSIGKWHGEMIRR